MRITPPITFTSVFRSVFTSTSSQRNKPARSLVLLGLIAVATTALASSVSSTGSLRQFLFSGASVSGGADLLQPINVVAGPMMNATVPLGSASMSSARHSHTATRLSDGRVLIAGGENAGGGYLSDAEIFDPVAGTFSPAAGNMALGRSDHSAVKMADGKVLITGGRTGIGATNTTEFFDPSTGTFANGPIMGVARAGHSATLFADGTVLIAGGDSDGSAEIFDPTSGSFRAVGANLNTARSMHSAALLQDGRVLLVGGRNAAGDALSSEIFDPADSSFSAIAGELTIARVLPHLRVLFDGKVQIIGGNADESMEIYDPVSGELGAYAHLLPETDTCTGLRPGILTSQTRAALFHNGQSDTLLDRSGHTINELPASNQALVAGGLNSSGSVLDSISILASSPASITTDKLDYSPGETATISGRGFQPGEMVRLKIHEDPHTPQERGFDATADADGNFAGEYLVQDYDLAMKFIVSARGLTSGWTAHTTFTDGNVRIRTNAAGITFTLTWKRFDTATCSGSVLASGTEPNVGFSGGERHTEGAGNTESIQLTATATSDQGGAFINWTSGPPSEPSTPANPTASLTICVPGFTGGGTREYVANYVPAAADLAITKTDSPDPVNAGDPLTYTIAVNNLGPNQASGVSVSDIIPAGLTVTSATWTKVSPAGSGTCTGTTTRTCAIGTLDSGSVATVTIVATVTANTADGTLISNTATVTSTSTDPVSANNSSTTTTTVRGRADVSITKADSPDPVSAGSNLTYNITVTNTSTASTGSTAKGISVSDTLPADTTFVSASGSAGVVCSPTTPVICTVPNLAPGASATITIVVTVGGCARTLSNTATVTTTTFDPATSNNSATATTTVKDTTAPTITCPANATVECTGSIAPSATGTATASDTCDSDVTVTYTDGAMSDACGNTGVFTRTWKAKDDAGNEATCEQTITIVDTTDPTISDPADVTVECSSSTEPAATGTATGSDSCGDVTISYTDSFAPACGNTGVITRTWTATDECGNDSTSTQTITIVDTTDPTISDPADAVVECTSDTSPAATGTATGSDTCGTVTITYTDSFAPACGNTGVITRTWTATDECGNDSTSTQTITIMDTTDPTISDPADAVVECTGDTSPAATGTATGSDTCGTVTITYTDSFAPACGNTGVITRTWTATDECGNDSTSTQTITIVDTTDPTISDPADAVVECTGDTSPAATGTATGSDTCGTVTITYTDSFAPACGNTGVITRTWTATDECGNDSSSTQTISIVDTTDPTISDPADATVECSNSTEPAATGTATGSDSCGTVTITHTDSFAPACGNTGVITRTWTATDECGNDSSSTQTITIVDTTDPTISDPADVTVECTSDTSPAATGTATGNDSCGTVTITYSDGAMSDACGNTGQFVRTWTATDECGNSSTSTQTITIVDTTDPTISDVPDATVECTNPTNPSATGTATGSDSCGTVTITYSDGAMSDACGNTGQFVRTWTATDECGNSSSSTQTITIVDTTPPSLTVPPDQTVECPGSTAPSATGQATGSDTCGNVTITYSDTFIAGPGGTGVITRTWTATDDCGNKTTGVQIITIVDTTKPMITLNSTEFTLWPPDHKYVNIKMADMVASVSDSCNTTLNASAVFIMAVSSDEPDNIKGGDGNTINDIVIANDCKSVDLRAERDGSKNGRVYRITFGVRDASGNLGIAIGKVTVPKSQGIKGVAVEDPPVNFVHSNCP